MFIKNNVNNPLTLTKLISHKVYNHGYMTIMKKYLQKASLMH